MKASFLAVAVVFLSATQALPQSGTLTEADKAFLTSDRRGATYELESAKLASKKAVRADIKSYAEKLIRDHEAYNAALETLGKAEGLTLPTEPEAADRARLQELEKLSGSAFEALYIKEAVRINAEDKRDADKEKATTKIAAISDFIGKFASMDAEHEELARRLAAAKS